MTLNDPELVRAEYSNESRFTIRQSAWTRTTGPEVHDLVLEALREISPVRVLEVGPGKGELAERMVRELGADVVAVDQSERMVELARTRGVNARLGDVQELPFADESFDACVAAWMLYHVPDLHRGLSELARVLRPAGRLVAVTNSVWNLTELWTLVGEPSRQSYPFSAENAADILASHFGPVERRDARGTVTFSDAEAARSYVAASVTRAHLAKRMPEFSGPLVASRSIAVFIATKL